MTTTDAIASQRPTTSDTPAVSQPQLQEAAKHTKQTYPSAPPNDRTASTLSDSPGCAESTKTAKRQTVGSRRWLVNHRRKLILTDAVIVFSMVIVCDVSRYDGNSVIRVAGGADFSYFALSLGLAVSWLLSIGLNGGWDGNILGTGSSEYRRIVRASLYLFGFIAIVAYLSKANVARAFLLIALPLGLLGLLAGRWVWRQILTEQRRLGKHLHRVLIVGEPGGAILLASKLSRSPDFGYQVAGLCLPPVEAAATATIDGYPVVGDHANVMDAIYKSHADTVAVTASEHFGSDKVRDLAWKLEGSGANLILAPALTDIAGPRVHVKPVAGLPLLLVQEPQFRGPKLIIKTALDLSVALISLAICAPLLIIVALVIKLSDGGPIFFRQERVGRGGQLFRVWKFRSMRTDTAASEAQPGKTEVDQSTTVFYKSINDPRITPVGHFIRKTSIDELPQLFNVLTRKMSIVGPRPLVPGEGAQIGGFLERRSLLRPGITGLWQVSGRSNITADERIRLDFYYVANWSVITDLAIMIRTARIIFTGEGAY